MRAEIVKEGQKTKIATTARAREMGKKGGSRSGEVRRENKQRRADLRALFGVEPLSAQMVRAADSVLLAMNMQQLKELASNEEVPIYMRRRARLLLQPDDEVAFETAERMLDRAFGKPKQAVEMEVQQKAPITILADEVEDITQIDDEQKL